MEKEGVILKRFSKSIKHLFFRGTFSSPPLFFLALILFLALLFKIFYKFMPLFLKNNSLLYFGFIIFILMEVVILLIFLLIHLESYEFTKENKFFKSSEFDERVKKKNYFKKKSDLRGTILWKRFFDFAIFSFYYGVVIMERPFWLIRVFGKSIKNTIGNKRKGFENFYGWRKIYDTKEKEYIYFPFVIRMNKKK
tara:strand:- start:197 stop:781 length:585 start_codon:yes stop_codon:yes gene_type:complete